jgi:hypothetical protein
MIYAFALAVIVPLAFWGIDVLIKILGNISIDDAGSDLCLFAITFNATTLFQTATSSILLTPQPSYEYIQYFIPLFSILLITSIFFYLFSLIIISRSRRQNYPAFILILRQLSWKETLTVIFGFISSSTGIGMYVYYT